MRRESGKAWKEPVLKMSSNIGVGASEPNRDEVPPYLRCLYCRENVPFPGKENVEDYQHHLCKNSLTNIFISKPYIHVLKQFSGKWIRFKIGEL